MFDYEFREGCVAGIDGLTLKDNPYATLGLRWWAWLDGLNEGASLRRKAVR